MSLDLEDLGDTGEVELRERLADSRRKLAGTKNGFRAICDDWLTQLAALPRRVLIVDDNLAAKRSIIRMLEGWDIVDTAPDGERALEMLCANRYQLVLMDLRLPGASGMETIHKLRRRSMVPLVPVIVVSGAVDNQGTAQMLAATAGATRIIQKPVRQAELQAAIDAIVDFVD